MELLPGLVLDVVHEILHWAGNTGLYKMSMVSKRWREMCFELVPNLQTESNYRAALVDGNIVAIIKAIYYYRTVLINGSPQPIHEKRAGSYVLSGEFAMEQSCLGGSYDLVWFFIKKIKANTNLGHDEMIRRWNHGLYGASSCGDLSLVILMETLIRDETLCNWNKALYQAAYHHKMNIINYIIGKTDITWDFEFLGACAGGHIDLMKPILMMVEPSICMGLYHAGKHGHMHVVKYLLRRNNAHQALQGALLGVCSQSDLGLIDDVVRLGAVLDASYFEYAAKAGISVVEHIVKKGIPLGRVLRGRSGLEYGMKGACEVHNIAMMRYLEELGATHCGNCRWNGSDPHIKPLVVRPWEF